MECEGILQTCAKLFEIKIIYLFHMFQEFRDGLFHGIVVLND
jgi:hypothetical protein